MSDNFRCGKSRHFFDLRLHRHQATSFIIKVKCKHSRELACPFYSINQRNICPLVIVRFDIDYLGFVCIRTRIIVPSGLNDSVNGFPAVWPFSTINDVADHRGTKECVKMFLPKTIISYRAILTTHACRCLCKAAAYLVLISSPLGEEGARRSICACEACVRREDEGTSCNNSFCWTEFPHLPTPSARAPSSPKGEEKAASPHYRQ